jgi:ATP-binding cassette subfamily F protein uup
VLAPEGGGKWKEYAGGYTDWLRQRPAAAVEEKLPPRAPARDKPRAKLSYKETRELEALPGEIEALELEQKALEERMRAPDFFKAGAEAMRTDSKRAEELERALLAKLERWEALEGKAG